MKENFLKLGFNEKEYAVFLYLTEYGISASSEISKYLDIPKSTVNFISDNLWKRGFVKKSFRGNTGYYEVDIDVLEKIIYDEINEKKEILKEIIPLLKEKNKNIISKPKIIFIDGLDNCKKAYLELLKIKGEFYEIGSHIDLEKAFGEDFMSSFIENRVKNNIICITIGIEGDVENVLFKKQKQELRKMQVFSENFGKIYSTIVIYENKVLILNLNGIFSGTLIENKELAETLKTVFNICKLDK